MIINRKAVASLQRGTSAATALRLNDRIAFFPQGSRSGNPGLEEAAPLGQ